MKPKLIFLLGVGATAGGATAAGCGSTSGDVLDAREAGVQDGSTADTGNDASPDSPGDAAADGAACAPDASFDSDPANCGRCGHDCQRGACVNGACQPVLLGSGCFNPYGIAVDDTRVYWTCASTTAGEIRSVAKDGTAPITHASDLGGPAGIFVDATTLIYIERTNGKIWFSDKIGGTPRLYYDPHASGAGFTLTADANNVYWIDIYGSASVFAAPRTGIADGGAPTALATNQPYLFGIAQDTSNVYFTVGGDWVFGPPDGGDGNSAVMKAPKDGSSAAVALARGAALPRFVDVDPNAVYWANADDDTVVRLDHGATSPVVIARTTQPFGVTPDGNYLYVTTVGTDQSDGLLLRVRKDGTGAALVVASGLSWPTKPAVDTTAIYWANSAGNTVMKIAK
jgi:hypothetical protein